MSTSRKSWKKYLIPSSRRSTALLEVHLPELKVVCPVVCLVVSLAHLVEEAVVEEVRVELVDRPSKKLIKKLKLFIF